MSQFTENVAKYGSRAISLFFNSQGGRSPSFEVFKLDMYVFYIKSPTTSLNSNWCLLLNKLSAIVLICLQRWSLKSWTSSRSQNQEITDLRFKISLFILIHA